MTSDEFKDVGRYFDAHEYVRLPMSGNGYSCTIEGWFIWLSGDGPLFATLNDEWELLYDQGGRSAYRVGGEERTTQIPVHAVRDRWIYLVVAKAGPKVILRLNDTVADHWDSAPRHAPLSDAVVMKDAVGFAADIAYYRVRVPDDRLAAHWQAGKERV